ncbi:hypothetical protein BH09VER1_BH09VER1_39560 [soil metagenome]
MNTGACFGNLVGVLNFTTSAMDMDYVLLQQLDELSNGQTVHKRANLSAAYRGAIAEYQRTGDEEFKNLATEAHRELRILLTSLRESRFSKNWLSFSARFEN